MIKLLEEKKKKNKPKILQHQTGQVCLKENRSVSLSVGSATSLK